MYAILKATEHSKHMHCKTVIMTESLSCLTALERVYPGRNSTIPKILNLLAEEGEDLKVMWVPRHTGIEGNESANKAAKEALHEKPAPDIRATENDWFKWTKEAATKKERNKWFEGKW
jgi:ribonuclease HI